ncbi:hypothetical protein [Bacillus sp. C1]
MKNRSVITLRILMFITFCIMLLSGCQNTGIDGVWELSQKQKDNCPVYYKFETVVKKEKKETIVNHLVDMYTRERVKGNLYSGIYLQINKGDIYNLDYGDSFTSTQSIKRNGDILEVFFSDVDKLCTYKKAE